MTTVQDERKKAKALSCLHIVKTIPSVEEFPTTKVVWDDGGEERKCILKSTDCSSVEHLLVALKDFEKKRRKYGWNGAARFDRWDESLDDTATDLWELAVDAGTGAHTEAEFYASIRRMILKMAGDDCHANFVNYLKNLKKPHNMDTFSFQTRLEILLGYKSRLPLSDGSAAPAFTDLEQREIVLKTYPSNWIANFDNSGQRVTNATLTMIRQYMVTQHANEVMEKAVSGPKKRKGDSRCGRDTKRPYGRGDSYNNNYPYRGDGGRGYGTRGRGYEGRGGRGRGSGGYYGGRGSGRFGGNNYRGGYHGGRGLNNNQWQPRSQYGGDQQHGGGRGNPGNYFNEMNHANDSSDSRNVQQPQGGGQQRGYGNFYNEQQQGQNGPTVNRY